MKRYQSVIAIIILITGMVALAPFAFANLIENGSFEFGINPPTGNFRTLYATNTDITGWVLTDGQVDWINTYWQASNGNLSLDLVGIWAGTIEQSFSTTIGQEYLVNFDMAGNPGNGGGVKELRVQAAGQFADFSFDSKGKELDNMGWVTYSWQFEATNTTTTLSFRSLDRYGSLGPALDNITMDAVPIPGAVWLVGSGLIGLAALRKKLK